MEILYGLLVCCCCIAFATLLPTATEKPAAAPTERSFFASEASQLIATNLLKSNIDIDGNQVHSPLGVASILAVLAEGSNGETFDEFSTALGYPKDRAVLRETFKRILGKYHNREYTADPSFQTWLYIYRNYSAREEFKQVMREHYFVEVKEINRYDYDLNEPSSSLELPTSTASNSKDVIGFETLKRIKIADDDDDQDTAMTGTFGEEILDKEASKFDRDVDDKQYVEKPVILEEMKRQQAQQAAAGGQTDKLEKPDEKDATDETNEKTESADDQKLADESELKKLDEPLASVSKNVVKREQDEENETVQVDEKQTQKQTPADKLVGPLQEVLDSNEPQKVSIPLQKLENAIEAAVNGEAGEIMLALESHIRAVRRAYGARSLFHKDDITTALSANSITGRDLESKAKMLLFNGLYYRGNWAIPFTELRGDEFFYMTSEDAIKAPMMHAKGKFHIAELDHLNAKCLCLPYENDKYAMMVMVPNELEGLRSLIDKLQPADLRLVRTQGEEKDLHIIMPKFHIEETTRSESMLKSLGLRKIFSRDEADLSLLSDDTDVHVDEVVQFVGVRVDEGGTSDNALSATIGRLRNSAAELESFEINRPFLYFVVDRENQFVIASGKVYTPDSTDEGSISIEVELEQV